MNKKLLFLLVLLLTAATGAWAQTETLLTTIESTANQTFTNGSKTFDEIATVTFSAEVSNDGDDWGWFSNQESDNQTITVTAASDAYTITRVKFYSANGSAFDEEAPFLAIVRHDGNNYITKVNGTSIGRWGLNKIEVYGYEGAATPTAAGYTVSLKDGVKDAGKWTVKAGTDGSFQSLPLKGVTAGTKVKLKYDGDRSMLKGVTAVKKAAAPAYTLLSAAATSDVGKVVCAAGHLHDAKTAVPAGCTAVGILGKVTETGHGLILALQDAPEQEWNTINDWESVTTYASTKLKVLPDADARGTNLTSYTTLGSTTVSNWAVAQIGDYGAIFQNLGSTKSDSGYMLYDDNVNGYITTGVGGTALSGEYWSAAELDADVGLSYTNEAWCANEKFMGCKIRPVLGF